MKHFTHIYIYCTMILGGILLGGCREHQQENKHTYDDTISVAVTPTLDCLPMILAAEHDFANDGNTMLMLCKYNAHADIDKAIEEGSICIGFTDNIRAENLKQKVKSLQILPHDNLDWQLIVNKRQRITEAKQLKDKMIAMTRLSATEGLSEHFMDSAKLADQTTFLVPINSIPLRLKMIMSNEIDAAWLPQPQATVAMKAGQKCIGMSRKSSYEAYGVVVAKTRKDKFTKEQLTIARKAYNEACDSLNKNGLTPYLDIIEKHYSLSKNDIEALKKPLFRHL